MTCGSFCESIRIQPGISRRIVGNHDDGARILVFISFKKIAGVMATYDASNAFCRCRVCQHYLWVVTSVTRGIGPKCWVKVGGCVQMDLFYDQKMEKAKNDLNFRQKTKNLGRVLLFRLKKWIPKNQA